MNKIILIVGLLLVIVGTGMLLNKSDIGRDYVSWLKSLVSDLNPLKAGVTSNISPDEGIDYSNIDFDEITEEDNLDKTDQTEEIVVGSEDTTVSVEATETQDTATTEVLQKPKEITLSDIGATIKEIEFKTEQVKNELQRLEAVDSLKKEMAIITVEIEKLSQEINEMKALEETDLVVENTEIPSEAITEAI